MTAASGFLSLPLKYLQDTIANSSTFQTWTSTANSTLAAARVHVLSAGSGPTAPFAVIGYRNWERQHYANGANNLYEQMENSLLLMFKSEISSSDEASELYDHTNNVGAILADMEQLFGTAGYLDCTGYRIDEGPWRPEEDEQQTASADYYVTMFEVDYRGA